MLVRVCFDDLERRFMLFTLGKVIDCFVSGNEAACFEVGRLWFKLISIRSKERVLMKIVRFQIKWKDNIFLLSLVGV